MSRPPELAEIIDAFRGEGAELLQRIGESILALERERDPELFRELARAAFRDAHSIKGAAATLDFGRVTRLVHGVEDVLSSLRDGTVVLSSDLADLLFEALDALDHRIAEGAPGESELTARDTALLESLRQAAAPGPDPLLGPEHGDAPCGAEPGRPKVLPLGPETGPSAAPAPLPAGPADEAPAKEANDHRGGGTAFVRISQRKLDTLLTQLGELVEMRIRMSEAYRQIGVVEQVIRQHDRPELHDVRQRLTRLHRGLEVDTQYLTKLLDELQDELTELRMVPVRTLFPILQRAVRDVARKRDVTVDFHLTGGEYELDRKIVEELKTPLIHLLRNAVDHGIEPGPDRQAAGKPAVGTVTLRVSHHGNRIRIEVEDDGRGLDAAAIHRKAVSLGLLPTTEERPPTAELHRLIFVSGMSTAQQTDAISGRGVGLDAVKRTIESLRGTLAVVDRVGGGTAFQMTLPLTLATEKGLLVTTEDERFVIPRNAVQQVVAFGNRDVVRLNERDTLWHEGTHYPLARLLPAVRLGVHQPTQDTATCLAVLLQVAESAVALEVDEVEAEEEIVVRSLGTFLQRVESLSGITFTASGDAVFVLNPADVVARIVDRRSLPSAPPAGALPRSPGATTGQLHRILVVDDSVTSRLMNQRTLSAAGYTVITAADGLEALELLRGRGFDLVLSDVQMPQLDGYELARRIKDDPATAELPVILLTALDRPEDRERGLATGADAYLVKRQMSHRDLLETVAQLIG